MKSTRDALRPVTTDKLPQSTTDTLPPQAPGETSVGLIADTHGWLDPAIHAHFAGVAHILHAGDIGTLSVLEALETIAPVSAVRGNIDGGALAHQPLTQVVDVAGARIAVLHIAGSPLRPNRAARDLISGARPDVLLVGHSHIAIAGRVMGTLWINPGAAGNQGFHIRRTAAVLRLGADGTRKLYEIFLGLRGAGR